MIATSSSKHNKADCNDIIREAFFLYPLGCEADLRRAGFVTTLQDRLISKHFDFSACT